MSSLFPEYKIESPHIISILEIYSKKHDIPLEQVMFEVLQIQQTEIIKMKQKSNVLFDDMIKVSIEEVVFSNFLIPEDLLDKNIILDLINDIKIRHTQFMPLVDGYSYKKIFQVNLIFLPNNLLSLPNEIKNVETAAISSNGDLILNTNFINSLLTWAKYKGTVGKTLWYNNPIKNLYTYIEFLILHEYYHIINGDLYFSKNDDFDPTFNNFACDLINNYSLLKYFNSVEDYLLPIGLWSSNYNFDIYKTKEEIFNAIKNDLNKENLKNNFDEHINVETLDKNKQTEIVEIENFEEDIDTTVDQTKDSSIVSEKEMNIEGSKIFDSVYSRNFDWKQILRKFLPNNNNLIHNSYSKISKRSISNITCLYDNNISSIKPGILKYSNNKKNLLLIIDNSGSILGSLEKISFDFINLLKSKNNKLSNVFIIKFDSKAKLFKLNLDTDTYIEYVLPEYKNNKLHFKELVEYKKINDLLLKNSGGGTIFNFKMVHLINNLRTNFNLNTIFFTDEDILQTSNFNSLNKVLNTNCNSKIALLCPSTSILQKIKSKISSKKNLFLGHF